MTHSNCQVQSPGGAGPGPLQAAAPGDLFRRDQWGAHLELDLGVLGERDVARVALVQVAVVDRGDVALGRADLAGPEWLAPLGEEAVQRARVLRRRLDVNEAVRGMSVQPVEAAPAADERALRGGL